jgi:hypothetical protein
VSAIDFQTRAIRARRATARIDPWFLVLIVAMLIIFGGFFAIGRLTADQREVEGPPVLQAASRSAVGAIRLSSVPPIAIPAGPKTVTAGPKTVIVANASKASSGSAGQPLTREISHSSLLGTPVRQPQASVSPASDPVARVPAVATPVASTPAVAPSTPRKPTGGGTRQAQPSSGTDGTFDSSG